MFILQHADSSAMGLVLQAGQFWQIINKDCLSNFFICTCKVALKRFYLFSKAVKKDQQVILVISLFPIILFIIARLVGSPRVQDVLGIIEEPTDLTAPLVVDLTALNDQPTNVLQGNLLFLLLLPAAYLVLLAPFPASNLRLCPQTVPSQAPLLQKGLPSALLPPEVRRISFPAASWSSFPATRSICPSDISKLPTLREKRKSRL